MYLFQSTLLTRYKNDFIDLKTFEDEVKKAKAEIEETDCVQIPGPYEIGEDGYPKIRNSDDWGDEFSVYVNFGGSCFHKTYRCSNATIKKHIYSCQKYLYPCSKCCKKYTIPDLAWYDIYLSYEEAKRRHEKMKQNIEETKNELAVLHKNCNTLRAKIFITFSRKNKKALQEANKNYEELFYPKQLLLFDVIQ